MNPIAEMVSVMLERDVPRDVIVTIVDLAERHAVTVTHHAVRHVTQRDDKEKAAVRAKRYREKKKRDGDVVASRDAQEPPLTSKKDSLEEQKEKKVRGRKSQIPPDFDPNWNAASAVGLSRAEAEREFLKFKNHAAQNGRTCINWQAAWSNWCIKAAEFLGKPPPKPAGPSGQPVAIAPKGAPTDEELRKKYGQPDCRIPPQAQADCTGGNGADNSGELPLASPPIRPSLRQFGVPDDKTKQH